MNDSFKCIILISVDGNENDLYNKNNNINIINDKNANMNYLPENNEFYIFTYIYPSKILFTSKKPILGKEIYKNLLKQNENDNNYIYQNNFSFYEFDKVYYTSYPYDEILSQNFPFQELINSNSIFIFSSQNDNEKTSSFNTFINIFLNIYDCYYNENQYKIKIISHIIFNKKIFQLDNKISNSPKETLNNLREIRKKKDKFCQESNLIKDNINFILRFQINDSEVSFVKLATKNLLLDNISFISLASDLINFSNIEKDTNDIFNIDIYEKINIISCINSTKENYSQSMKEIIFMNDIYKEINSIQNYDNEIIDCIKKENIKSSNSIRNKLFNNIETESSQNLSQNMNNNNIDNTIILPENTSENSDMKSDISNNLKIKIKNKEKLNELNSVFSYLENINNSLNNDRVKYESRISTLEEEIKSLSKDNSCLLKNYNLIKEKCDNLEENNNSLNKKFLEKENLSFCQKDGLSENHIIINKIKEKDNIIKKLTDENNKLKDKCKFYEEKYIQIKSNNAILNEKINHIENILKTLFNEK